MGSGAVPRRGRPNQDGKTVLERDQEKEFQVAFYYDRIKGKSKLDPDRLAGYIKGSKERPDMKLEISEIDRGWVDNFKFDSGMGLAQFSPLLRIDAEPFGFKEHFQLSPLFKSSRPRRLCLKTGRQVGKSYGIGARGCLQINLLKNYHILYIQPRFDQIKDFSTHIFRPFMRKSPLLQDFIRTGDDSIFLQSSDEANSRAHFSYAFLNPDRVRGKSGVSECYFDEVQDLCYDFIPIISATMDAVKGDRGFHNYTGTPKTTDNTLSTLFDESSAAEWVVPCQNCKKLNVPCASQDLLKMIGPTTVQCAKCQLPLDPRLGWYEHANPGKRNIAEGYHVSQITHPLHYRYPGKWAELRYKQETWGKAQFFNEVLGEPCDEAVKPITLEDLYRACNRFPNSLEHLIKIKPRYASLYMGVDWSGKGADGLSTTAVAIVGTRMDTDAIDCLFAERLPSHMPEGDEVRAVLEYANASRVAWLAHDYTGAGSLREVLMLQSGVNEESLAPFTYVASPHKDIIQYNGGKDSSRRSWSLDKSRSLAILFAMIRSSKVTLPDLDDHRTMDVCSDLLSIAEETREMPRGSDIRVMVKLPKRKDDFAHALNIACAAVWNSRGGYPTLDEAEQFRVDGGVEMTNPADMPEVQQGRMW